MDKGGSAHVQFTMQADVARPQDSVVEKLGTWGRCFCYVVLGESENAGGRCWMYTPHLLLGYNCKVVEVELPYIYII